MFVKSMGLRFIVVTFVMIVGTVAIGLVGVELLIVALLLLLGVGEAFCYPVNAQVTALWFRRSERGLATGIWASGSRVGSARSIPLVAFIISGLGWRAAFFITGAIGLVWMFIWYAF